MVPNQAAIVKRNAQQSAAVLARLGPPREALKAKPVRGLQQAI